MEPALEPGDLERLFLRGALTRRHFMGALLALGVTSSGLEALVGRSTMQAFAQSASPQSVPATYVVLIVLDAFRADYRKLHPMPALQALAREGISYDRAWVGQLQSETPTSHATLATGAHPSRTGIVGFEWRDPTTMKEVYDAWPVGVLAGDMERDLRLSGLDSIPSAIKAANPHARVVTLSSEKVYAADAMGSLGADYILFNEHGHGRTTVVPSAVPGHVPPKAFFSHPALTLSLPIKNFSEWDWLSGQLALAAFDEFLPTALMVNLPGTDVYGHSYGPAVPRVMSEVISGADYNIARIVGAYKKAGIYDRTLFVVVADHGMVPNDRMVGVAAIKKAVSQAGGAYYFHWGGTGACIWLHNPPQAQAVASAMLALPGVSSAYYQATDNGQYQFQPAPGLKIDPALDAANQYLLSTFAGPRAPDVIAPFRENTIARKHHHAHGDHGGLNWGSQHVPLIIKGPGVKANATSLFPARLVDIAPTVLGLLGIPVPASMDGIVLADAFAEPQAAAVAAQSALEPQLQAVTRSLVTQSHDNIAEDKQLKISPPPPRRIKLK